MRVRMKSTQRGAIDPRGFHVVQHLAGEVYDLPGHLASVYLEAGFAELADGERKPSETQAAAPAEAPVIAPQATTEAAPSEPVVKDSSTPPNGPSKQGKRNLFRSASEYPGEKDL